MHDCPRVKIAILKDLPKTVREIMEEAEEDGCSAWWYITMLVKTPTFLTSNALAFQV